MIADRLFDQDRRDHAQIAVLLAPRDEGPLPMPILASFSDNSMMGDKLQELGRELVAVPLRCQGNT
jgi:hypothetical protein